MPSHHPLVVKTLRLMHLRTIHLSFLRRATLLATGALMILLSGCGQTGIPQAPSLQLPTPVTDLTASRIADRVTLQWTMPRRTTDKLALKGLQPVQICRRTTDGPCLTVGTVSYEVGRPASYDDKLPLDLIGGSPQLLAYSVDVLSMHGRSAGASNIAYAAGGSAPPPFIHAAGKATAKGVVLQWQPAPLPGTEHKVNIERTLLALPAPAKLEIKPAPQFPLGIAETAQAKEQTLVVRLPAGPDPGQALDPDAAFDQRYSYRISRVTTVSVAGRSIDIEGPASGEIVVDTKDIFPPSVPTDVAAVAAPEEGAIDLSWSPNTETDLAGYAVYRSQGGGPDVRISALDKPIETPSFRDTTAQSGPDYVYSVTAIDRDGNESPRSAGVKEMLPPKP